MIKNIRNFVILSHVDHGKSTLADRFLELTNTIPKEKMIPQFLDKMDLERRRGITIKMHPVRMLYHNYILNLIDTPGHVDFSYEVERSLKAVEGAILLVDATKGIQAQTLSNYYLAKKNNLTIIPVVNKIDLVCARVEETKKELIQLTGEDEVYLVSAKLGIGVEKLLRAVIDKIPSPKANEDTFKSLVFDSLYDEHRGVVVFIRVFSGKIGLGQQVKFLNSNELAKVVELGIFRPEFLPVPELSAGEIGYLATGIKQARNYLIGDTLVEFKPEIVKPIAGYKKPQPKVFASFYCLNQPIDKFKKVLEKICLTDPAFGFEPEASELGNGFRCSFLGTLHLDIIKERLEELGMDLIVCSPSVRYQLILKSREVIFADSLDKFPPAEKISQIKEPWINLEIFSPPKYLSAIIDLVKKFGGNYLGSDSLGEGIRLKFELPLVSLLRGFYDSLKSISSGFASLSYKLAGYRENNLQRVDIKVADKIISAFSFIVPGQFAYLESRKKLVRLKKVIPRQLFEVKLQACIGSRVIAKEVIKPLRKDVLAKLYGGDRTRKNKLLEKQKLGKKKLKKIGKVRIPQQAFYEILKL